MLNLFNILAALIADRAGCLARRLARCLALAAAAFLCGLFIIPGRQCLDVLHTDCLLNRYSQKLLIVSIIYDSISYISTFEKLF